MRTRLLQADVFKTIVTGQSASIKNLSYEPVDNPMAIQIKITGIPYVYEYPFDTEKNRRSTIKTINKKLKEINKKNG